jgi:hypothetical protein
MLPHKTNVLLIDSQPIQQSLGRMPQRFRTLHAEALPNGQVTERFIKTLKSHIAER